MSLEVVQAAVGALPAAHTVQAVQAETPPGEKDTPATQGTQADVLPAGLAKPALQTVQTRFAVAVQADVCAEPAAQLVQGTHADEPRMGA